MPGEGPNSDRPARRELLRASGLTLGVSAFGGFGLEGALAATRAHDRERRRSAKDGDHARSGIAPGNGEHFHNAPAQYRKHVAHDNNGRPNCSSIIVGKDVAADDSMILGHNEDLGDYPAQHYINVPHATHRPGEYVTTYYGARVPQVRETFSYTGSTIFDISYIPGDVTSGINEHNVAVVNNASYRRDAPAILPTDGRIIWTEFTKFALERARTAVEAVEVIGDLASRYKLGADSGTIFGVIDPTEGWWVEVTLEGQWAAQRVAPDTASERANIFGIGVIDFDDPANFRYSDDLVSYARRQGWYVSGPFNFTSVYAEPDDVDSPYNTRRTARMRELLEGPVRDRTVDPQLIMTILRDHYEGTPYDLTDGYTRGSPHQTDERTLCRLDTEVSTVIQARAEICGRRVPADIGAICWRAMATPCTSIYTPWYLGSRNVPKPYRTGVSQFTDNSAYWTARNLSMVVDMRYRPPVIDRIKEARERFEGAEFRNQAKVEATALRLYDRDPCAARDYLSRYTSRLAMEALAELAKLTRCVEHQ